MHTYNIIDAFNFEWGWIVYEQNICQVTNLKEQKRKLTNSS